MQSANTRDLQHAVTQTIKKLKNCEISDEIVYGKQKW